MISHKSKKTEAIPSIFADLSGMKPKFNDTKKMGKFINIWKLSYTLLDKYWVS
jgi:hypothetical protein